MRTATDFDRFYSESADPWKLSHAGFRDRALRRAISAHVTGKTVLELGSGEGHLTSTVFERARRVTGIDISSVAVDRARLRSLPNAEFVVSDFLSVPLSGYDVITAIECLYYLSSPEQDLFIDKIGRQHGGLLIVSAPIIGGRYYTHDLLLNLFRRHRFGLVQWRNLALYWNTPLRRAAAAGIKLIPWGQHFLDAIPDRFVYQRCYLFERT
jgi:2-polyprenyl-3-methyl-5-hydroxy-6-metoxy-1,4-benzoquinol methylase